MKSAFVFPGQGSQKVGMGKELAAAFASARYLFEEVDEALGQNLSKLIFEGPAEDLNLTENTQPALMAVSMAVIRVLQVEGNIRTQHMASYVAGHSLGEYSALSAAESLDVTSAAKLLKLRGQAMQSAVPVGEGAMAALLGADMDLAREIAMEAAEVAGKGEICVAANDNAPGQVVLSGTKKAIDAAINIAKDKGVKRALPLQVSAPSHSPLMQPAADQMGQALAQVNLRKPVCPVITNVSAGPEEAPQKLRKHLVDQLTGVVRWRESVEKMADLGVSNMLEIGAGNVLCGLIRRINPDIATQTVGTPQDVELFLKKAA